MRRMKFEILLIVILLSVSLMLGGCHIASPELASGSDDRITLSVFMSMDSNLVGLVDDYNELAVFQEIEKRFDVNLEFVMPDGETPQEKYNDMLASGNLTDIIIHDSYGYPGGREAAVRDGYYMDLTPYMDTYLKDYYEIVSSDPDILAAVQTDSGIFAGVYRISVVPQGPWMGLQIRKDWLDDLGLDIPVTYDDWEKVLTAFKLEKDAYAPLSIDDSGTAMTSNALSAGYSVMNDYMNVDGTIEFGPANPGWKDYLIMMNRWYAAGLIDPDFMINGTWQVDENMVVNGMTGAWNAMYVKIADYEKADPNIQVIPVAAPVVNSGDQVHIRCADSLIGNDNAIPTSCKYPEKAMEILNYFFTEEGSLLANYGIEGDTFIYDDSGHPVLTEKITANDAYTPAQAQALYLLPPSKFTCYYDWTRELQLIPEKDHAAYDIWGQADDSYMLPKTISYTADEAKELSLIMEKVSPYVNEMTLDFILGEANFDHDYEIYLETLEVMGIQDGIAIVQEAIDRYQNR